MKCDAGPGTEIVIYNLIFTGKKKCNELEIYWEKSLISIKCYNISREPQMFKPKIYIKSFLEGYVSHSNISIFLQNILFTCSLPL